MEIVLVMLVFLVVFGVILKLALGFSGGKSINKRRIAEIVDSVGDQGFAELSEEFNQEKPKYAQTLENINRKFGKKVDHVDDELALKLVQAGWTSPAAPILFIFFSTFGGVFSVLLLGLFYLLARGSESMFYVIMSVGIFNAMMMMFGAQLWLKNSTDHRKKTLMRSFPDALDLLLVCVESGLALDASLARVCNELRHVHPEITRELNKTRLELAMLNDRERALNNLGIRTDLAPFKSLIAAILQSEKFGTSLVDTIRVLSDDYRQTRMMAAEEAAGKLPTKIAVSSIPFLLLALIILIASPAALQVINN